MSEFRCERCGYIYDKNGMKSLVAQGFLSPENYQKIVGEAYVTPQTQSQPASQA